MEKQRAYVLHHRPYRETSALVDFFTPEHGLMRCMARGAKKQIQKGHTLQPFTAYEILFHGDSDLKNLDRYDALDLPIPLQGDALFSGFYVNEVILRALRSDADVEAESLFYAYEQVLTELNAKLEYTLRIFELTLLEHMGQCYEWSMDFKTGEEVIEEAYYGFFPEQGMSRVTSAFVKSNAEKCFSGRELALIAINQLNEKSTLNTAKRLLRLALQPIIGYKPIQARELLKQFREIGL